MIQKLALLVHCFSDITSSQCSVSRQARKAMDQSHGPFSREPGQSRGRGEGGKGGGGGEGGTWVNF